MKFRTDINGLRTYAVLAVIIFHFNKEWLSGGFAGVDVFFVISGYLMTSIIFRGLENNSFSIWKFYVARIKRIVPALLALVIVLMAFGYLFLGPIPYADLAKHSGGSMLFLSNIMYWKESGYFDTSAIEKFLLHTWSLSVEWQFYIIYPIALRILSKLFKLDTIKKIIAIGTVLALLFSIYASQKWTIASYFLLPTRMWEMLLGGIAFLYPFELKKQSEKHILELSGLALIIVSFFVITENTIWPGYTALIPTLGAFILLQANNEKSIFTNNIICQKLGLWSYSLYLWHWSLLVTYNYFEYKIKIWPFLFVTLAFGITSYYLIEKRKWNVWLVICIMFITLLSVFGAYKTNGAAFRIDPKFNMTAQEFHAKYYGGSGYGAYEKTYLNSLHGKDIEFLTLGDSYMRQYAYYIDHASIKSENWHADACIISQKYTAVLNKEEFLLCSNFTTQILSEHDSNDATPIIWAQNWGSYNLIEKGGNINNAISLTKDSTKYTEIMTENILEIHNILGKNRKMYLVGEPTIPDYNIYNCLSGIQLIGNKLLSLECSVTSPIYQKSFNNILKNIANNHANIFYLDPNNALCINDQCTVVINNEPLYSDTSHLSIYGSELIGKFLFNSIKNEKNNE